MTERDNALGRQGIEQQFEDRRGQSGGGGGFGLGGGGGLGIGAIVILGLIGWALGIDPRVLIGGAWKSLGRKVGRSAFAAGRPGPAHRRTE